MLPQVWCPELAVLIFSKDCGVALATLTRFSQPEYGKQILNLQIRQLYWQGELHFTWLLVKSTPF